MPPDAASPPSTRRAAVVANPTKHDDVPKLRDAIRTAMAEHSWDEPLWFETTQADPGAGRAAQAVRSGVDLVLACGGDGTVTACAEGVAGSGVPLGILPLGTGNLLARNLRLPLDPARRWSPRSPAATGGWMRARPTGARSWSWPAWASTPRCSASPTSR